MSYPKLEPRAFAPLVTPTFTIGDFTITYLANGKIWIRYKTGEAGEFSTEGLEEAVKAFFWENF